MDDTAIIEKETPDAPLDLRGEITEQFEKLEAEPQVDSRPRDDSGKFIPKEAKHPVQEVAEVEPTQEAEPVVRPSGWNKDHLPLWEKMASGQTLTPEEAKKLAKYSSQRDSEYKTGVSTYKAEADKAANMLKAVEPFMPELQKHNIPVTTWITNLGNAHHALALGTPQQKLQMFAKLAQDYGVPLGAVSQQMAGQQPNPDLMAFSSELSQVKNQLGQFQRQREMEQQNQLSSMIDQFASDTDNHPHFERVRPLMAQLIESNLAPDLATAYQKAVRMDDEVFKDEQERLAQASKAQAMQRSAVSKAKANAVSVRSVTPSGSTKTSVSTNLRDLIASNLDAVESGRL